MKPHGYTHRESGENLLLGVELLTAWLHNDRAALARLLLGIDPTDTHSAVIAVCRAARSALTHVTNEQQIDAALTFTRDYALMRRDELGGDPELNESNKKG